MRLLGDDRDYARYFTGYDVAFILKNLKTGETVRLNPKGCAERLSPCSTFKIPNSLIGLETGVISGPEHKMKWDGVRHPIQEWNQDQTLRTAIKYSVVWYYQRLAAAVGTKRMDEYINRIPYGNRDTSGGITQFWLGSTLRISPEEQVKFVERLAKGDLPFSRRSQDIVRDILVIDRKGDSVLRGKTGTWGDIKHDNATLGWFVGYATKGKQVYAFATRLRQGKNPSGHEARAITRRLLHEHNLL